RPPRPSPTRATVRSATASPPSDPASASASSSARPSRAWRASPRWPAPSVPRCSSASPSPRRSPSSVSSPASCSDRRPTDPEGRTMNNVIAVLAQEGETLPLEESPHPLIPPLYDIVWSLIPLVVILWLFWKFVLPKFQQVLDEREERIEGGLERAEQTQAEAKEELAKYRAQLA